MCLVSFTPTWDASLWLCRWATVPSALLRIIKDADVATAAIRGCMADKDFHLQVKRTFSYSLSY